MMNENKVNYIKEKYKKGITVELISMDDPYGSVPAGTKGIVDFVDDTGTIFVDWENGSSLGLIVDEDKFKTVDNLEKERINL